MDCTKCEDKGYIIRDGGFSAYACTCPAGLREWEAEVERRRPHYPKGWVFGTDGDNTHV